MEQKFSDVTADDEEHLQRQRNWVRDHFVEEARWKYDDIEEKLYLIALILQ